MSEQEFEKLINRNKYQVFIFAAPCSFPINFAKHLWFVTNKKGVISRWEILLWKNRANHSWDHLYLNFLPPTKGIEIVAYMGKFYWKSRILETIEGNEDSVASKMIDLIQNSKEIYPYYKKYNFLGPNSNTYIQWMLDKFPELKVKLPWGAVGNNYK